MSDFPVLCRPLTSPCLADVFAWVERTGKVAEIRMNSRLFLEMRRFYYPIYDHDPQANPLGYGFQGVLWGALLFTLAELKDDEIVLVDGEGKTTRFEVLEKYPYEIKVGFWVQVDGNRVRRSISVPFAKTEHLDVLLKSQVHMRGVITIPILSRMF